MRLGDIDLSSDQEPSAPVTFKVTDIRAHPRFSRVGFYNDIASKFPFYKQSCIIKLLMGLFSNGFGATCKKI